MRFNVNSFRGTAPKTPQAHDLVIKAVDCRAITPMQVPEVLHVWREPEHDGFRPRNAWRLFKGINSHTVVNRSQGLHGLFDGLVGLS